MAPSWCGRHELRLFYCAAAAFGVSPSLGRRATGPGARSEAQAALSSSDRGDCHGTRVRAAPTRADARFPASHHAVHLPTCRHLCSRRTVPWGPGVRSPTDLWASTRRLGRTAHDHSGRDRFRQPFRFWNRSDPAALPHGAHHLDPSRPNATWTASHRIPTHRIPTLRIPTPQTSKPRDREAARNSHSNADPSLAPLVASTPTEPTSHSGRAPKYRYPRKNRSWEAHNTPPSSYKKSGGDLLSQGATPQVPSARAVFTAVFGMGTGVSPPQLPPEIYEIVDVPLRTP